MIYINIHGVQKYTVHDFSSTKYLEKVIKTFDYVTVVVKLTMFMPGI